VLRRTLDIRSMRSRQQDGPLAYPPGRVRG
jgi:hypothetical protein